MSQWIYVLGEVEGTDLKIGHTGRGSLRSRLREVNGEANADRYVLLAAVRGVPHDEAVILDSFRRRTDKGTRREYIHPDPEAVEYAAWLRSQWFAATDLDDPAGDAIERHADEWLPGPGRRWPMPSLDPDKMVQDWETMPGPLQGTAWSWMPNPRASFQDYFTPPEIVDAARHAMGGIDLDAASHWAANKAHRIPDYFDATRSAFLNPWHGRVWLNPPYGENAPWFQEIERWVTSGEVTQLCMISPVWAFTTKQARPVMELTSAMVLLVPTPKFWGNANPDKTGTNNPHAVIYIGERDTEFLSVFSRFGIPLSPIFAEEFIPEDIA